MKRGWEEEEEEEGVGEGSEDSFAGEGVSSGNAAAADANRLDCEEGRPFTIKGHDKPAQSDLRPVVKRGSEASPSPHASSDASRSISGPRNAASHTARRQEC